MSSLIPLGGTFTPVGTNLALKRMGYGTIQLTGPMAFGPPRDRATAISVVQEAVRLGVNHIDTSDFYGPHIANEIIREAIHPYPEDLVIVTKVGVRRGPDKSWPVALSREELISAVHDNLRHLGLETLEIVNLRVGDQLGPNEQSIAEPLTVLAELQAEGLIRNIGLSNASPRQYDEAAAITRIVCVQNHYNLAHRSDDDFIETLAAQGVAYVPFFPLGGFRPIQSTLLDEVAASLDVTARQVALAWLLQRSPNMLIIAGTSSIEHLRENVKAATLSLRTDVIARLDQIAAPNIASNS